MTTTARQIHSLNEIARAMTEASRSLDIVQTNIDFASAMADSMLKEQSPFPLLIDERSELEAFRALAAEVKYYVDKWPKYAGEHMKRLAALCPEGYDWTPDGTP